MAVKFCSLAYSNNFEGKFGGSGLVGSGHGGVDAVEDNVDEGRGDLARDCRGEWGLQI